MSVFSCFEWYDGSYDSFHVVMIRETSAYQRIITVISISKIATTTTTKRRSKMLKNMEHSMFLTFTGHTKRRSCRWFDLIVVFAAFAVPPAEWTDVKTLNETIMRPLLAGKLRLLLKCWIQIFYSTNLDIFCWRICLFLFFIHFFFLYVIQMLNRISNSGVKW